MKNAYYQMQCFADGKAPVSGVCFVLEICGRFIYNEAGKYESDRIQRRKRGGGFCPGKGKHFYAALPDLTGI